MSRLGKNFGKGSKRLLSKSPAQRVKHGLGIIGRKIKNALDVKEDSPKKKKDNAKERAARRGNLKKRAKLIFKI